MLLNRVIFAGLFAFCFLTERAYATEEPDLIQADLTDRVTALKKLIAESTPSDKERLENVRIRILDSLDILQVYASREEGIDYITVSKGFAVTLFQLVVALQTLPAERALSYVNYMVDEDLENAKRRQSSQPLKEVRNPLEWAGWSSQAKEAVGSDTPKGKEIKQMFTGALAFVLAHELGHHVLGHTASAPRNLAESRVRETDADRWACRAVIRAAHAGPLVGVYAFLYYAALDNYALQHEMLRSHPAELKRIDVLIDATIEGLANDTVLLTGSIKKEEMKAKLESIRGSLKTAITKEMPLIANPGENTSPASVPAGANDLQAAANLARIDKQVKFHLPPDNEVVDYDVTYENESGRPISASIAIAIGTVPGNGSTEEMDSKWKTLYVRTHKVTFSPHSTAHIKGQMRWYSDGSSMPLMHIPDPSKSRYPELYACTFSE